VLKKTFPFITVSERKLKIGAGIVFWSWNVLALCLVFFGLVPHVLVGILREASQGLIPWSLTAGIICLMVLPVLAVVWGVRFFRRPGLLFALFYGLEVPLGLFCLFRIFLVRELTPALAFVIIAFFIACSAFAYELHRGPGGSRWEAMARLCAQTVAGLTSLTLGAVLLFYVPVVAVAASTAFLGFGWVHPIIQLIAQGQILLFVIALLFALSAALFLAAPIALIVLHCRCFLRVLERSRALLGKATSLAVVTGVALALVGLFIALNHQPQHKAFDLLSRAPTSDSDREHLLASAGDIREGLVAAYLAPYRFLSARGENNHLTGLYREVLGFSRELAGGIASVQNALIAPLLYAGDSMSEDQARADTLYAEFFDTHLQRRERLSILRALAATWDRDQRSAGLLNQDQRQVKLARQEIRVEESGSTATVEIHDQYENQTYETQEVFVAFTLPEGAAVTGLWLGDSADRDKRFVFTVSPRGAAQAVYRAEVARRADPALIEQTGPGQYRLRAFPVQPKSRESGRAPALHLWLTYVTHPEGGHWPTPRLVERRNLYWDGSTERSADKRTLHAEQTEWVGLDLPVKGAASDGTEEAVLPGGYLVRREPWQDNGVTHPTGQKIAVVVDRSYSMLAVRDELRAGLEEAVRMGRDNDVDVYFTSAVSRGEPALRIDDPGSALARPLLLFGGGSLKQGLRQLDELRQGTVYDGIFVFTDGDSFDSADDGQPPSGAGGALWIVHLGGHLAAGYDDPMLDLLNRSGGGVATTFADAFRRYAARKDNGTIVNVEGKHRWTLQKTTAPETPTSNFARLAARQLILALGRDAHLVGNLDNIHRIAVQYQEVSVYSSMIVLVDEAQRQALAAAEQKEDRFERKVESGKEVLQKPSNPLAFTATPEPHEWLLIGLALAAAIIALWQRRSRAWAFLR
jgi:putative PEP-CTERM system integral membrane protein